MKNVILLLRRLNFGIFFRWILCLFAAWSLLLSAGERPSVVMRPYGVFHSQEKAEEFNRQCPFRHFEFVIRGTVRTEEGQAAEEVTVNMDIATELLGKWRRVRSVTVNGAFEIRTPACHGVQLEFRKAGCFSEKLRLASWELATPEVPSHVTLREKTVVMDRQEIVMLSRGIGQSTMELCSFGCLPTAEQTLQCDGVKVEKDEEKGRMIRISVSCLECTELPTPCMVLMPAGLETAPREGRWNHVKTTAALPGALNARGIFIQDTKKRLPCDFILQTNDPDGGFIPCGPSFGDRPSFRRLTTAPETGYQRTVTLKAGLDFSDSAPARRRIDSCFYFRLGGCYGKLYFVDMDMEDMDGLQVVSGLKAYVVLQKVRGLRDVRHDHEWNP